uniref:G-protein coupled receptors family 1 profile domain-containing protein n=1 Tax=Poecilia latipinna TaxID=48699 RepID=A0A3B3TJU3_9TELE
LNLCSSFNLQTMDASEFCFPEAFNSSCKKKVSLHSVNTLIYFGLSFMSLVTTALNLLVIISISHFRKLHTPTNFLLLSLAVSDFLVGLFMFFQIMVINGCWVLGDVLCVLYYVFSGVLTSASVGTMVLISLDRYLAICDPLRYSTKVTTKRVQICVSLCWICSVVYILVLLRDNFQQPGKFNSCSGECVVEIGFVENVADLILTFIISITVLVVLYVRVFVVALSQVQAMRSHIVAVKQKHPSKTNVKKSELKAAGILGVVVVAFVFCICPYYCVTLIDAILNTVSTAFVLSLFYFNSCLNPLIYAFFYSWLRKAIRVIVTLQILQSGSSDASLL